MPAPSTGLTLDEVNFLRRLTREPDFRAEFFSDRERVAKDEGLELRTSTLVNRVTATEIDGLYRAANAVGRAAADDNCTLVYALAFAVAFALL